ncbi:MAG: TonB-dependent receptor [Pseudobacteriovorax sp.]|nr:TonB-dependent receptor [Pseudobacteriovorax sp.]
MARLLSAAPYIIGLIGSSSLIQAKESDLSLGDLMKLANTVSTASKYSQNVEDAPAIVQVFDRSLIEASNAQTISDLLAYFTTIHIGLSPESRDLAWVRGAASPDNNRILVLIDGIPFKDGFYNHGYIDEYIPLNMVKKVEFIKGPGSSLYGANAFAAVINLITFDGKDVNSKQISIASGTFYERRIQFLAGGEKETDFGTVDAMFYGKLFETQGNGGYWRANRNIVNFKQERPERAYSSGMKIGLGDFTLRAQVYSFETDRIDAKYGENNIQNLLIEDAVSYRYFAEAFSLDYNKKFSESTTFTAKAFTQHYNHPALYGDLNFAYDEEGDLDYKQPSRFNASFTIPTKKTYRNGAEAQLTWSYGSRESLSNILVAGVELSTDGIDLIEDREFDFGNSETGGDKVDRDESEVVGGFDLDDVEISNKALFIQNSVYLNSLKTEITTGVRVDDHKFFGNHLSPRGGLIVKPIDNHAVKVLYGEAFRAPVARELLIEESDSWTSGNKELEPEVIETAEIQYSLKPMEYLTVSAGYFTNRIKDIIDVQNEKYENVGKQTSKGTELSIEWRSDRNYIYLMGTTLEAKDGNDKKEFGVPETLAKAGFVYRPSQHLWVSARGQHIGEQRRKDYTSYLNSLDPEESIQEDVGAYELLDLTIGAKELVDGMTLSFNIHNLTDRQYYLSLDKAEAGNSRWDDGGFPGSGRSFRIQADYKF